MGFSTSQLRQILRRLRRTPMFTAIALFTLAAGIGANTAVFSVVEGVLLKPLPFPHADRLVGVWHTAPGVNIPQLNMGPSNYFVYRDQSHTFQDIGLYQYDSVSVTGTGEPEQVLGLDVTEGTLPILGISPLLGRIFTHQDVAPGAPKTVVLTYAYWQRKFGGKPSALGQTIRVDGEPRLIIGVLPERFHFLDEVVELILPTQFDRNKIYLGSFSYEGVARLKPGATIAEANADVARMLPIVMRTFPAPPGFSLELFNKANIGPDVHPLKQDVIGQVGTLLWVLMGSIGLVLLIACANVANLLLVRAEGRQQELTIRAALGATRGQIAGELLLESLVLGLMGSVLGLGLAYGALRVLVAMAPSGLPRVGDIGIDGPVLLFTLGVSLLASLLFGAVPVFKYAGSHAGTGLREGGRTLSQSRERHRARNVLVTVQVALAFVLLVCSGLMIRTFRALTDVNPGFYHPAEVQSFRLYIPETEVKKDEDVLPMQQEMLRKVAAIPGVSSAGIASSVPMDTGYNWMDPVFAEDHSYAPGELPPICRFVMMSPEFFSTMGTPLIAGRIFTWSEVHSEIPLAVVSAGMARQYWGSPAAAVGKRIRVSTKDDWREVIGVVGDVHDQGMNKPPLPTVYWPLLLQNFESETLRVRRGVAFAVRSPQAGSPGLMNELRQAVWSVDANLPLYRVHTADYYYQRSMARTSFTLVMLGIAGAMALLLGTVGLYGVIAYSVSQRTREIGIRMALGAREEQLTGMFVRQGLLLTGLGVVCGIAAAIAVMRLMSSLLFGVNPIDPVTYGAVMIGLAATAFLASYLPSRRARAVDPVVALRTE